MGGTPEVIKSLMTNLADLAQAAVQLNEKSNSINATISKINEKLANLNLGIELWLEAAPLSNGRVLGYRSIENRWQLTIRMDLSQIEGAVYREGAPFAYQPLIKATRELRVEALPRIPALITALYNQTESMISDIERAEQFAAALDDPQKAAAAGEQFSKTLSGPQGGDAPRYPVAPRAKSEKTEPPRQH